MGRWRPRNKYHPADTRRPRHRGVVRWNGRGELAQGSQLVGEGRRRWPLAADLGRLDGAYLDLVGVEVDGRIGFQRQSIVGGVAVLHRMVWLDVTTDAFRWQWQRSGDSGRSWELVWEIDYRRA